jgi:hypothetical protein
MRREELFALEDAVDHLLQEDRREDPPVGPASGGLKEPQHGAEQLLVQTRHERLLLGLAAGRAAERRHVALEHVGRDATHDGGIDLQHEGEKRLARRRLEDLRLEGQVAGEDEIVERVVVERAPVDRDRRAALRNDAQRQHVSGRELEQSPADTGRAGEAELAQAWVGEERLGH